MKVVHLMGIGGSGMASLAGMFVEKGWIVRGSDEKVYPPASTELARLKVEIFKGYKSENLYLNPDLVIVGNVVSRGNPEVEALLTSKIPYTSMAQALADYFIKGSTSIVITGTHGKTTTTSLLAWILEQSEPSPGLFVGGIPLNFEKGYQIGSGKFFVTEGDEYDTAFFEKTPKFIHYLPHHAILTSIEFDHADIYKDLDHVRTQFDRFVRLLPKEGALIACGDSDLVRKVCSETSTGRVEYYGKKPENEWRVKNIHDTQKGKSFELMFHGKRLAIVNSPLLGDHNVLNVAACLAIAKNLGLGMDKAVQSVETFLGVKRRQEFLGEGHGVALYDDFAHHPTAISETLSAFTPLTKERKGRLWAVFEPRSNTIRRRIFQETLPLSFILADEVIIAPVYRKKDQLSEQEILAPNDVALQIREKGKNARAPQELEEIVQILLNETRSGDVVVFMSNGNFEGIPLRVKNELSKLPQLPSH